MTELKYFKVSDFDCQETGENEMDEGFLNKLDHLRHVCAFPFYITSGYRSPSHPIEKSKRVPGTPAPGIAADISVSGGAARMQRINHAAAPGFPGTVVAKGFVLLVLGHTLQ